jgi:hypothetical protein
MVDKTFALPSPNCGGNAILQSAIGLILSTAPGANIITLNGIASRLPDLAPVTVIQPTTTTAPSTTQGSGGSTQPAGNPTQVTPVTAPARKFCVVPRLVGKTLKQAKRALKKAGCKVGKSKKKNSKKRKKGRILKQRYKVGKKLPLGTKVPITLSKGQKKSRKR